MGEKVDLSSKDSFSLSASGFPSFLFFLDEHITLNCKGHIGSVPSLPLFPFSEKLCNKFAPPYLTICFVLHVFPSPPITM